MPPITLRCVKSGSVFPFSLDRFNNPAENSPHYANLVAEGGYTNPGYLSKTPFQKVHFSYGAKNTPLRSIPELAKELGVGELLVKDESFNPYGTHKDRRSEYIVNIALEHGVDKIVCLTAGNAGYSLSRYCARVGIDYTSMVFPRVSEERKQTLRERGHVMVLDSERENGILWPRDFVGLVREHDKYERGKEWNRIWSVTNSFEPLSVLAYKELMYEIAPHHPDYVVVPCGSGDIIVGIRLAIQELGLSTKIIGVGPADEHPLQYALSLGIDEYELPAGKKLESLADKLRCRFTANLPILVKIFQKNVYIEININNKSQISFDQFVNGEISGVIGFYINYYNFSKTDRICLINTGTLKE